jgi:hypothetical protein
MSNARHISQMQETQIAQAWASFNGSTNTLDDSFNVTSITDRSGGNPGQYVVNFENTLTNTDYAVVTSACVSNDGRVSSVWPQDKLTSSVNIFALPNYGTISYVDVGEMSIAVFSAS